MKTILTLIALLFVLTGINAQDNGGVTIAPDSPNVGSQKFLLTGAGSAMFTASKDGNTFMPMSLMLMPMTKINDRLFLESGMLIEFEDGDFQWGIEALNLHYRINPWLTVHFGKFAAPWGNVLDMFGEGFVSRFPTTPIGLSDDGMAPTDQVGLGFQGGFQAGSAKMLYDVYLSNGPQLIVDDGSGEENLTGHMSYEGLMDNNKNKAIGGKIGILPFASSSLQVDVFAQTAGKTGDAGSQYENVSSNSYGADFNFYKTFNPILIRLRGQYEGTQTSSATYTDTTNTSYTFDNNGNSWYLSGTLRPTGSKNKFLSSLEFGTRFVKYSPPKNAPWGGDPQTQLTFDLTYWFTWSSQINFGYDIVNADGTTTSQFVVRSIYKF